jgi:hypothetical protein
MSTPVYAHGADDFASAFAEIVKDDVEAVMVQPSLPRRLAAGTALRAACLCSFPAQNLRRRAP